MLKEFKEEDYYIPSLEELIVEIINNGEVYTVLVDAKMQVYDVAACSFTDDLVQDLLNFIKTNNFDTATGYSIDTSLYRIKRLTIKSLQNCKFYAVDLDKQVGITSFTFSKRIHNSEKVFITVYRGGVDDTVLNVYDLYNSDTFTFLPNIEIKKTIPLFGGGVLFDDKNEEVPLFQGNVRSIGELNQVLKLLGYGK